MVFHDVSRETRLFRQLSYQAAHDSLTGLINRQEFENQLVNSLENLRGNAEETHALLYLDLDQFKVINDTFGHSAGDALLKQLADVVHAKIRSTDLLARLGGDEFGILLERCDEITAIGVAEAIRSAIEAYRVEWKDSFAASRCCLSVVMITVVSDVLATISRSADVSCDSAKGIGRSRGLLFWGGA